MGFDYSVVGGGGKWIYMPKVGQEITVDIEEIRKVDTGDPKFHFTVKKEIVLPDGKKATTEENLGWHIECVCASGQILTVTSMSAFYSVFKKHNIQTGIWKISHLDKGKWDVTCMNVNGDQDSVEVPF
jgi:hypothetical protein